MNNILASFGLKFADDLIIFLLTQVPEQVLHDAGYKVGQFLTDRGTDLLGDDFNNVEDKVQVKLNYFVNGIHNGLNYDD